MRSLSFEAYGKSTIDNYTRLVPMGYVIVGTCGKCGGAVISPQITYNYAEQESDHCMDCGAIAKPIVKPLYGPVRDME